MCVITDRGVLECWGANERGAVGNGATTTITTPQTFPAASPSAVFAGYFHTCAIDSGAVRCAGENSSGQLGDDTTTRSATPVAVRGLAGAVAGAGGGAHTCVVDVQHAL